MEPKARDVGGAANGSVPRARELRIDGQNLARQNAVACRKFRIVDGDLWFDACKTGVPVRGRRGLNLY